MKSESNVSVKPAIIAGNSHAPLPFVALFTCINVLLADARKSAARGPSQHVTFANVSLETVRTATPSMMAGQPRDIATACPRTLVRGRRPLSESMSVMPRLCFILHE